MSDKMGTHHGGPERSEIAEARAQRILSEELKRRGWDAEKTRIARRLRSETTMTSSWIAGYLQMGVAGYAAKCLRPR